MKGMEGTDGRGVRGKEDRGGKTKRMGGNRGKLTGKHGRENSRSNGGLDGKDQVDE